MFKIKDGRCETLEELFSFYNLDVEMLNFKDDLESIHVIN